MKCHATAEEFGVSIGGLAVDIDDGLKQRSEYHKMGTSKDRNGTFDCNECGETFSKFWCLTRHRREKHNFDNGFQCKTCGRSYPSRYFLEKHYKQHKRQENKPELSLDVTNHDGAAADDDDPLTLMKRKPYARGHAHRPKSEFICETCDTTYKRYNSLKQHMITKHSSNESFVCSKCDRMYPNQYYLRKHMMRNQCGQ